MPPRENYLIFKFVSIFQTEYIDPLIVRLQDTESQSSKNYTRSLKNVLDHGVRVSSCGCMKEHHANPNLEQDGVRCFIE